MAPNNGFRDPVTSHLRPDGPGQWRLDMTDGQHLLVAKCDDKLILQRFHDAILKLDAAKQKNLQVQVAVVGATRIGDDERESAVKALSEHLQKGRLNPDEFEERMAKALLAQTQPELDDLLGDLPAIKKTVDTIPKSKDPLRLNDSEPPRWLINTLRTAAIVVFILFILVFFGI